MENCAKSMVDLRLTTGGLTSDRTENFATKKWTRQRFIRPQNLFTAERLDMINRRDEMRTRFFRFWLAAGAVWAACGHLGNRLQAMQADDKAAEQDIAFVVEVQSDEDSDGKEQLETPKLWLGITLKPIEGDLAAYLGSSEGVLVDSVFPDSPASAAGLKKGDILVSVGDEKLTDPKSLLTQLLAVKSSEDGKVSPLQMKVLRNGESKTMEVTPVARPVELLTVEVAMEDDGAPVTKEGRKLNFSFDLNDKSPEELEKMLEKMRDSHGAGLRVFRFGAPARVLQSDAEGHAEARVEIHQSNDGEQMEISIHREGDAPAKIKVSRNGESKEYSSDKLDDIPEETRKMVTELLNKKGEVKVEMRVIRDADEKDAKHEDAGKHSQEGQKHSRVEVRRLDGMKLDLGEFMDKEISEKYSAMAKEMAARAQQTAKQTAKWAHEAAAMPEEIKELRLQVEALREQVKELREQLKSQAKQTADK
jgi:hypothetical protein